MNNRYFGNIHDFCKYGLLRHMAAECGVRLGVCWMLTSGDGSPNLDFQHLRKRLDPELHNWLQTQRVRAEKEEAEWGVQMMEEGRIGGAGVIPNADYFGELMPDVVAERRKYFGAMLDKFRGKKDLIFLDPDFGLGFTAREFTGERGDGYLHAGEVARCVNAGFSVMFYQDWRSQFPHPNPKITHGEDDPATKIRGALRREGVRAPVFRLELNAAYEGRKKEETGGTIARFFLVQHPENSVVDIEAFLKSFQESAWCKKAGGVFVARQRVGVFIDAENSGKAEKIRHMLDNIHTIVPLGEIVSARMFGKPGGRGKSDQIGKKRRALQEQYPFFEAPCEVDEGSDEAEVAMAVDIHNKITQGEVDAVVVFARDHLNRPIARIAGESGVPYHGVGETSGVSPEYQLECAKFFVFHERMLGLTLYELPRDKIRGQIADKKAKSPKRRSNRGRKKQQEQEAQCP